jgi:plastocyanin
MLRRKTLAAAAVTALAGSALIAGPASAATKTLNVIGSEKFNPGVSVTDNQRFQARVLTVAKNDKIKIVNKTGNEHTFSTVKKSDLPKSFADFEKPIFGKYFEVHGVPEGDGPPAVPVVDGFAPVSSDNPLIIDEVGDSTLFPGKKQGPTLTVGADTGANLWYLCLIHPWMQGKVQVR